MEQLVKIMIRYILIHFSNIFFSRDFDYYIIFSTMTEHFEKQTERIRKRNDEDYDEVSFSDNFSREIVTRPSSK